MRETNKIQPPLSDEQRKKIKGLNSIPLGVNFILNLLATGAVSLYVGLGAASISDRSSGDNVHASQMELGSGISGLIAIALLTVAEICTLIARMTLKEPEEYRPANAQNPQAPGA